MDGQFGDDEDLQSDPTFIGHGGEGEIMEDDRSGEEALELSNVDVPEAQMPDLDVDILREIHQANKGDYFYVKREDDYLAIYEYLESFNPRQLRVEHKPKLGFRIMRYGN